MEDYNPEKLLEKTKNMFPLVAKGNPNLVDPEDSWEVRIQFEFIAQGKSYTASLYSVDYRLEWWCGLTIMYEDLRNMDIPPVISQGQMNLEVKFFVPEGSSPEEADAFLQQAIEYLFKKHQVAAVNYRRMNMANAQWKEKKAKEDRIIMCWVILGVIAAILYALMWHYHIIINPLP